MTLSPDRQALLTSWRRALFYIWIGAALVAMLAAVIGGPLTSTDGVEGTTPVALISPIAMLVFVVTGMAWIVLLALSHRSKYTREPPPG